MTISSWVALTTSAVSAVVVLASLVLTLRQQRRLESDQRLWGKKADVYAKVVAVLNAPDWGELSEKDLLDLSGQLYLYGSSQAYKAFHEWMKVFFLHFLQELVTAEEKAATLIGDPLTMHNQATFYRGEILVCIRKEYGGKKDAEELPLPISLRGSFDLPLASDSQGES